MSPVVIENDFITEEPSNKTITDINTPVSSTSSQVSISFKSITPIPNKPSPKVAQRRSAKQHSTVLTSTPIKVKLELIEKKREMKKNKEEIKLKKQLKQKPKPKSKLKRLVGLFLY